ncbi:MAG: hypothetical protein ACOYJE_05185 [Bacteroidaceae bacterium]|jgi:hypothetical protein
MKLFNSPLSGQVLSVKKGKRATLFRSLLGLALLALPLSYAAAQQVKGDRFYENYTQISNATASTNDGNSNRTNIQNVVDGNGDSYWQTGKAGSTSLTISFNRTVDFNRMTVKCPTTITDTETRPATITLEAQVNNSWITVETFPYDRSETSLTFDFADVSGVSQVRLSMTTAYNRRYIAISEIEFYQGSGNRLDYTIVHRYAKWHTMRSKGGTSVSFDTFDDSKYFAGPFTTGANDSIQATHTYIDTIYMHKGQSITLSIPDKMNSSVSASAYQRWYNFRTDGLFQTGNRNGGVYDLLTPTSGQTGSRLSNGYVGSPLNSNLYSMTFYYPTDDEFSNWEIGQDNNNYYLVAVDVSPYKDFYDPESYEPGHNNEHSFFNQGQYNCYEPTLSHRVLFYVIGVDGRGGANETETWKNGHGRLTNSNYQGGGNGENSLYLEEYEISMPFTRISGETSELISLSKDAQSYAIPGVSADDDGNTLNISIEDNAAGITLVTAGINNSTTTNKRGNRDAYEGALSATISGENRRIFFAYPNSDATYGTKTVDDEDGDGVSTATILVTKTAGGTTYNIARYRLTFRAEASLLTYSQLEQLKEPDKIDSNVPWKDYSFRVPENMENNPALKLLTKLDFDYDINVSQAFTEGGNYQAGYYPFPLEWGSSSYSFYDGSTHANGEFNNTNQFAEWGFYSLMRYDNYKEYDADTSTVVTPQPLYEGDTYHLYIDASDRPGIIAQIPFTEPLCAGSELFVTAWVKSANAGSDDAAMLFTIMGVDADGNMTPLYRHYTGQIRRTDRLSPNIPGCGNITQQEWLQLYFSFINEGTAATNDEYESYVLQIENYCASTGGGDFCLDNIRIYIAQPSATVTQLESTCVGEATKMNIALDWNRLASRLGIDDDEASDNTRYIDIAFLNLSQFERDMEAVNNDVTQLEDLDQYLIPIYGRVNGAGEVSGDGAKIASIAFNEIFGNNASYNANDNNWAFSGDYTNGVFYRQGTAQADNRELIADFYSTLTPNYPYVLLISPREAGDDQAKAADLLTGYGDVCAISTDFRVTSQALLKVNGEVVSPDVTYCAGNIFNFSTQVQIPYTVGGDPNDHYFTVEHGVYFDWFFGTEDEYLEENSEYGNVSLRDALIAFREEYPDAETLSETETPAEGSFSEDMYNLIHHYLTVKAPDGSYNQPLVLHQENINITLLESGLYLIVQPIKTDLPPGEITLPDDDGTVVDEDLWATICWEYIPLMLETSDEAPELHAGFGTINYPNDAFNPNLRIGLKQIEAIKDGSNETLTIDLRGAKATSDEVEFLGIPRSNVDDDYNRIFLIGTNDPAYADKFGADFSQLDLPVGTIEYLRAYVPTGEGSSRDVGTMQITFDKDFEAKEGYYYNILVRFEEYTSGTEVTNSCMGQLTIRMDVVPEYLVWQGGATDNWSNDNNWRRADNEDLNYEASEYVSNDENYADDIANARESAYVPMLFSKVIMPANSVVELYPAGFMIGEEGADWGSQRPSHIGAPTQDIQYDLMVYEKTGSEEDAGELPNFSTQQFRVSLCDQIHFEPGAQMLNAQYLLYNTAWVDVKVPTLKWTNVGLPLSGVVAGDWYTQESGTDKERPYFREITDKGNSPYVYQRSWGPNVSIIETAGGTTTDVTLGRSEWSAAYNDASVPYTAGAGFSLKASEATYDGGNSLLFRFPKSNTSYTVQSGILNRDNAGKLASSELFTRNKDEYNGETIGTDKQSFGVDLQPSEDGQYFIVGNPFVTHLDVVKFLEANEDVLAQEYWTTGDNGDPVAGVLDEDATSWVSTTGEGSVLVAPHEAFYVKRANENETNNTVTFTAAMQSLNLQAEGGTSTTNGGLVLTAANAAGRSTALVSFSNRADDGYAEGEDVQLVDFGAGAYVPLVYSVAGQKAAAINRLAGAQMIPLGVYATDEEEAVTLSFNGVSNLAEASLYDAETRTETPLTEGYTMTLKGSSHGRYFLRATGDFTGLEELPDEREKEVSVYSPLPGELIVAAVGQTLERVRVYDAAGALCYDSGALNEEVCRTSGLAGGTYVVTVQADGATHSYKVALK